jgi:YegS/Rv2252/BmrU family lipid kinase
MRVIVNPRAGRGSIERSWPSVDAVLEEHGLERDVVFTTARGHAERIARAAIEEGCRFVVAVGGDGTVHEVVNGMMSDDGPRARDAVLGVLPSGSGCDFARTFGLPQDPFAAARHLAGDTLWGRLDIGRVRYRDADGAERARWFCNIAEAGIGAQVVVSAAKMPRWLGGRAYRLAALRGIAKFKPRDARIAMNGRKARGVKAGTPFGDVTHDARVTMFVVANCQFFGGGLRVAPRAIPSDAMLDVLVGEGSKWEAVKALQKMPAGSHVPDATISEYLVASARIESDLPLEVEADGEPLGTTPASFDIVADAIALKI